MANNIPAATGDPYIPTTGTATAVCAGVYAMGRGVTTGRNFWLRGVSIQNASGPAVFCFFDGTEGGTATSTTRRVELLAASGPSVAGVKTTTYYNFAAPGIKFATGCVAARDCTNQGAATTLFGPGSISAYGYEEA